MSINKKISKYVCQNCLIQKTLDDFTQDSSYMMMSKSKCSIWCKRCQEDFNSEYEELREHRKKKHREGESRRRRLHKEVVLVNLARQRAKSKNIECTITSEDLLPLPEFCEVLGIKLNYENTKLQDNSPSVDRIDCTKGYVPNNVKIISWRANCIKRDASIEEIEKILHYCYKYNHKYRNKFGVKKGERPTKFYTYKGESKGLKDWAEEYNIKYETFCNRIHRMNWDFEKALLTPVRHKKEKKINIFFIDADPIKAANLCDSHLIKMTLESCQLLSTYCEYINKWAIDMYKPCYHKHPSNLWLRDSTNNVAWLLCHLDEMYNEYWRRYGKYKTPGTYKTYKVLYSVICAHLEITNHNELLSAASEVTHVRLAMPEEIKVLYSQSPTYIANVDNAVLAYRNYYNIKEFKGNKKITWTAPATKPDWYLGSGTNIPENKEKLKIEQYMNVTVIN